MQEQAFLARLKEFEGCEERPSLEACHLLYGQHERLKEECAILIQQRRRVQEEACKDRLPEIVLEPCDTELGLQVRAIQESFTFSRLEILELKGTRKKKKFDGRLNTVVGPFEDDEDLLRDEATKRSEGKGEATKRSEGKGKDMTWMPKHHVTYK